MTLDKYTVEELKRELSQRANDGRMLKEKWNRLAELRREKREIEETIDKEQKEYDKLLEKIAKKASGTPQVFP
jgi:predicted transcriptional regulator